ncbi:unnamed protein product [Urochloa humidicola]
MRGATSRSLLTAVRGCFAFSSSFAAALHLHATAPLLVAPRCRFPTFTFAKAVGTDRRWRRARGGGARWHGLPSTPPRCACGSRSPLSP